MAAPANILLDLEAMPIERFSDGKVEVILEGDKGEGLRLTFTKHFLVRKSRFFREYNWTNTDGSPLRVISLREKTFVSAKVFRIYYKWIERVNLGATIDDNNTGQAQDQEMQDTDDHPEVDNGSEGTSSAGSSTVASTTRMSRVRRRPADNQVADDADDAFDMYMDAYLLGHRVGDPDFQDACIDAIVQISKLKRRLPPHDFVAS